MVFSSLLFLTVFLPIAILLYYLFKNRTYRNVMLVIISLAFYAWGEPFWIILLLACSCFVHWLALLIENNSGKPRAKAYLITGISILILILAFFKYSGFVAENLSAIFRYENKFSDIALPLGLSFYTFTCISYLTDIYRKKLPLKIILLTRLCTYLCSSRLHPVPYKDIQMFHAI